jgi:hypothetical protein
LTLIIHFQDGLFKKKTQVEILQMLQMEGVFGGIRVAYLILGIWDMFSVLFVFVLCLVPNVACFCQLFILDCHFGFL